MFSSSKVFRAASVFAVLLIAAATVFADTIKLRDGSVIKGKIVEFKNQQITIVRTNANNRQTTLVIDADDIETVEFDSFGNLAALINNSRSDANAAQTNTNNAPLNTNSGERAATINPDISATNTANANQTAQNRQQSNNSPGATNTNGGLSQVINSQPIQSQPVRPQSNQSLPNRNSKFVPLSVKVLADNTANGWTNTGLVVKKGQRLRISANGRIAIGNGQYATPAGIGSIPDAERLMKTEPTGALIAVIGDDNNEFVFVGANREWVADRDGILFLGVNEGNLDDNSGAFDAVVEAEAS